jgi:thioredoxin 1
MSDNIVHTTDDGFDQDVLKSEKPVLVDYWAEWCGPCKMIAPILEEVAGEYADKLKVCKIDIDANQGTPPKYGIRGIPTLMLFKNGEVEATKVGALSKSQLQAFFRQQYLIPATKRRGLRVITGALFFRFYLSSTRLDLAQLFSTLYFSFLG